MADSHPDFTLELPLLASPRIWRLSVLYAGKERVRTLRLGESIILGSSDAADVSLTDPTVSARHCEVRATQEGLSVKDLGSKNGVYFGSGKSARAMLLGPRCSFSLGRTTVEAVDRNESSRTASLGLIGTSSAMDCVREKIRRFAPLRAPVLITGESGTGKDLVAQALHDCSGRSGRYFPLNVAALADGLLDAELFGHERGAFTGAVQQRTGLFEAAKDGTLFLDEVAEMSLSGQAKLLRVVEDGHVRALGAESSRKISVRLVSATCMSLSDKIADGTFRHDLFHRLSPLTIELPALRKRTEDIPLLVNFYLSRLNREFGEKRLPPGGMDLLKRAEWPGNVRQLFGVLYRAAALATGDTLSPGHLEVESPFRAGPKLVSESAEELLKTHGSISAAARAAGVPRTTFRSILERKKQRVPSS